MSHCCGAPPDTGLRYTVDREDGSLIEFASLTAARDYQRVHGGTVRAERPVDS